ncbi:MAG: di-trans,poly-cis-decaprenylcistransferase [Oscillospiraceae bacterium]|jgi:undecaprenyl diphosphate synthase|nr:di-trans,poly-cis-decaprenylcistransferase [Oscillospiraceae bacterium]
MDGNRRWAKARGLPPQAGHAEGAKVFRRLIDDCCHGFGIDCMTFYAFSTENKSRQEKEIEALTAIFGKYLDDISKLTDSDIRLKFIGDLSFFSPKFASKAHKAEETSANRTGMKVVVALNYGGRAELERAARLSAANGGGIAEYLYDTEYPDLDLLVRTGGEKRLSNFLLWQSAYAELYFTDKLWPDFTKDDLQAAIDEYASRNKRFGR